MVTRGEEPLPKYAAVSLETPVVTYTLNLGEGTSLEEAGQVVLEEFPPGARFEVIDDAQASCTIASIKSQPVQRALGETSQGNWVPIAAFGTSRCNGNTSQSRQRD